MKAGVLAGSETSDATPAERDGKEAKRELPSRLRIPPLHTRRLQHLQPALEMFCWRQHQQLCAVILGMQPLAQPAHPGCWIEDVTAPPGPFSG